MVTVTDYAGTETYYDGDGLLRKYGTTKTVANIGGEFKTFGAMRELEFRVDLTKLPLLSAGVLILSDQVFGPKVRWDSVVVTNETAAVGSGATLDLGLISTDRSTEIDLNGFLAAVTIADWNAVGETNIYTPSGTPSGAGALLGTTTTSVGYVCANYNTAAFTAGVVTIRIRYHSIP